MRAVLTTTSIWLTACAGTMHDPGMIRHQTEAAWEREFGFGVESMDAPAMYWDTVEAVNEQCQAVDVYACYDSVKDEIWVSMGMDESLTCETLVHEYFHKLQRRDFGFGGHENQIWEEGGLLERAQDEICP